MPKILKVKKQDSCIGCEMCVMECQRQLKKVGLEGSYIRILRNISGGTNFEVSIDPKVQELNSKKIATACPQDVFEETEESGA